MFGKKDSEDGLTTEVVMGLLEKVVDPELEDNIVALGMVAGVKLESGQVQVSLALPTPAWAPKPFLDQEIHRVLEPRLGARTLALSWESQVRASRPIAQGQSMVPGARNVILFASGKGGVGKSTVATNVAVALGKLGANVGLLDADIYGPSIPTMLGTQDRPEISGKKLIPLRRHGVRLMSIGFIVDPQEAMTWRGPMLNGALIQFMRDVDWGDLDYLILDLPPGTGDVQLTIAQNLKVSGAVLVSTPQEVALADVTRGKSMFDKVDIPTLGLIENMAYFQCPGCEARHHIFADGGASRLAQKLKVPLLGEIPLEIGTREASDLGRPEVLEHPESEGARAFMEISEKIATMLAKRAAKNKKSGGLSSLKIIQ